MKRFPLIKKVLRSRGTGTGRTGGRKGPAWTRCIQAGAQGRDQNVRFVGELEVQPAVSRIGVGDAEPPVLFLGGADGLVADPLELKSPPVDLKR
ncbi:MAG TPA: hypothetical protein VLT87_14550 [Thermoanaerobaculia bacterium]|nr:hypothetical protein [Thermoanaerobaculia bacterium]